MTNDLKILITGASGFLGTHLVKILLDQGYRNITGLVHQNNCPDLPIRWIPSDMNQLHEIEEEFSHTDVIIHLAAHLSYHRKDKKKLFRINAIGTKQLVDIAISQHVKKIIYVSSASTLIKSSNPTLVSQTFAGRPFFYSNYARSKYLGELEIQRAAAEGLDIFILNPVLMLGEGDWNKGSLQILRRIAKGLLFYPIGNLAIVDVKNVAKIICENIKSESNTRPQMIFDFQLSYYKFIELVCDRLQIDKPKFRLNPFVKELLVGFENIKSLMFKSSNIITSETANITCQTFHYEDSKMNCNPSVPKIKLKDLISDSISHNINNK